MSRMNYDSRLTDSQWQFIAKIFGNKEIERKRNHACPRVIAASTALFATPFGRCLRFAVPTITCALWRMFPFIFNTIFNEKDTFQHHHIASSDDAIGSTLVNF